MSSHTQCILGGAPGARLVWVVYVEGWVICVHCAVMCARGSW